MYRRIKFVCWVICWDGSASEIGPDEIAVIWMMSRVEGTRAEKAPSSTFVTIAVTDGRNLTKNNFWSENRCMPKKQVYFRGGK